MLKKKRGFTSYQLKERLHLLPAEEDVHILRVDVIVPTRMKSLLAAGICRATLWQYGTHVPESMHKSHSQHGLLRKEFKN